MTNLDPMLKVRLAERSLRVYTMGLLGLVPLLGLPLAGLSLWIGRKTLKESNTRWNPAHKYALAGFILGGFSITIQAVLFFAPELLAGYLSWVFTP